MLAPKIWGLLALLLIFNMVLAVTQDWHDQSFYTQYRSTLRQIQTVPPEEALDRIQTELESINALSRMRWALTNEDPEWREMLLEELRFQYGADYQDQILSGLSPSVRVNPFQRTEILNKLEAQRKHLLGYPAYLRQVQSNVETMKALSIFNKEGGFSSRNIEKTGRDFPTEVALQLDNDHALTWLVTDSVSGYTLLIFTLFLTLQLVVERKRGLWSLIHGAPNGRGRLAGRRCWILLAGVCVGTLVLLGGKLIFYGLRCGAIGSLSRNVQSLAVFDDFPWVMPVWVFLIGYFLLKILGMWLLAMAMWAILQSVNHLPLALCVAGVVLAGEFAMFRFIRDSYVTVIFRYVSLFALVLVSCLGRFDRCSGSWDEACWQRRNTAILGRRPR